ncbi:MAG: hypothetical protein ACMG5Z_00050 [Luteimonas sp.]
MRIHMTMAWVLALAWPLPGMCAVKGGQASGYFRIGDMRLEVSRAIAVIEDSSGLPEDRRTLVFLSRDALDAGKVAAAFDADDAVREALEGKPDDYVRLCIDADGSDCGLFFSPEGFYTGGYGELTLEKSDTGHITGRWVLAKPEDFFGKSYDFDLHFDAPITSAPGQPLPGGGGEPGVAYNSYLDALAKSDFAALRRETGNAWHSEGADATAAKEALKSLRDGQPLHADIIRGLLDGDQATLWVEGVDRDDIRRRGRVLMQRVDGGWRYAESDLDSVDE